MRDIRQPGAAAAALVASGSIYFGTEFIAAAAWTNPPYSYTHHFISNLGVHGPATVFGQLMYSPLAWVMNTGFVLFGIAALVGVTMLRGLPGRPRWAMIGTAMLLAAGGVLVGSFPGSGDNGTTDYHGLGAAVAFVSGNLLCIQIGRARRHLGFSARLGRALVLSGILGLVSLIAFGVVLASGAGILIGLLERGIVYPFLIGYIRVGLALRERRSSA